MKPDLDLLAIAVENLTDAHQATVRRVEHLETTVAGMVPVVMRMPDPNAAPRPLTPAQMVAEGSRLADSARWLLGRSAEDTGDPDGCKSSVVQALSDLRKWADILANIGWELPPCEVLPLDPAEHLRQAHDAAVRAQIGWEITLPGPLDTIADDIAVAIGHIKAWLIATAPQQPAQESQEQAPEPELAPEPSPNPADLLTLALERVMVFFDWDRARDGDARIAVRQALDLLRKWQRIAGVAGHKLRRDPHWAWNHLTQAADDIRDEQAGRCARGTGVSAAIAELERWVERVERNAQSAPADDDDVISAQILDADAAPEMPDLPPDPTPIQRAGQVIHHLGLAMMGQHPGPLHWVNRARWELQGWPGVAPQPETGTWGASSDELLIVAAHYAGKHVSDDGAPWHAPFSIACLDEWVRREAQA